MQVRVQLALLLQHGTDRHDAQLPSLEIEAGPRQHFAVSIDDHPHVERRVQLPNVEAEALVHLTVYGRTRPLPALRPFAQVGNVGTLVGHWGRVPRSLPPLAGGVEGARKPTEEVRLEDQLLHPDRVEANFDGTRHRRAHLALAAHGDNGGKPDELARGRLQRVHTISRGGRHRHQTTPSRGQTWRAI